MPAGARRSGGSAMRRIRQIAFGVIVTGYSIAFWYLVFAPTAVQLWARFES